MSKLLELSQVEEVISYLKLRIKQCRVRIKSLSLSEEISDAKDELEGLKFLLKPKKKERKKLQKELLYTLEKPTKKEIKEALRDFKQNM